MREPISAWSLAEVLKRDRGVCRSCHLDTLHLRRLIVKMRDRSRRPGRAESKDEWERRMFHHSRLRRFTEKLEERGFRKCFQWTEYAELRMASRLWELNHIKPVVLGGTSEPDNLETLCVPCHKAATRRLAKHRAHLKRVRIPPPRPFR